jgi:hypothetical protein
MEDMQTHLETLRAEAAECEKIAKLATDEAKRELFARLARHYRVLASEVERAIKEKEAS